MTAPPQSAALVALLRLGRRPAQAYAEPVQDAGSALEVLERELAETAGQGSLMPPEPEPLLARAALEIERWRADGIQVLTLLDRDYPDNLRAVYDRPPLIFVRGGLHPSDTKAVAVIGSRRASPAGLARAGEVSEQLVRSGYTVFSGLAAGIDAAAHAAALSAGGRTIAVIGTGLAHCYPPQNAGLQDRLAHECAVVSQFWPDEPGSRRSFPLRNAVMSGLSLATVIVEASPTSGTRIQARLALSHGRPVFVSQAMLGAQWARELAGLPGVYVFESPDQISVAVDGLSSPGALIG